MKNKKIVSIVVQVVLIALFLAFAIWLNTSQSGSEGVQKIVNAFGYPGILALSALSGFNIVVPVPVATFFPFFLEAGFSHVPLILTISIGMALGDALGFWIGHLGKKIEVKRGKLLTRLEALQSSHPIFLFIFMFVYAAVVPLPNEIVVIPLAFLGVRFSVIFSAVLLGNLIFNTILAYGTAELVSFFL